MKVLLFLSFLSAIPVFASAQVIDLKVKEVGIGATYQTVISQLGKPASSKKSGTNPCGGKKTVMDYPGLSLTLDEDEEMQNIVIFIEATSPKWEVAPGITVGANLENVRMKFGKPSTETTKSSSNVLTYFDGDGAATFYFRNKKLVRITKDLNLC
jgi:hypothetical protein